MPRAKKSVVLELEKLCKALSATKFSDKVKVLQRQGGGPLIEDISDKQQSKKVTFFYYDESKNWEAVNLRGQIRFLSSVVAQFGMLEEGKPPLLPMHKIEGSDDVWALTLELPANLSVEYSYILEKKVGDEIQRERCSDSSNPELFPLFPQDPNPDSVFDLSPVPEDGAQKMQAIIAEERLKKYSIDEDGHITLIDNKYDPTKHEHERIFTVHFPRGYDGKTTYPMRLFLDGKWYLEASEVPAMFDHTPVINIMLEPKPQGTTSDTGKYLRTRTEKGQRPNDPANFDRNKEYEVEYISSFTRFLQEKFIPKVREEFNISEEAQKNTICGSSLSGFAAVYIGLCLPDFFGNVLTQSASLWKDSQLPCGQTFLDFVALNLEKLKKSCFCLEVGSHEFKEYFVEPNQRFAKSFSESGIPCKLTERPETLHCSPGWTKFLVEAVNILQEKRSELDVEEEQKKALLLRTDEHPHADKTLQEQQSGEQPR